MGSVAGGRGRINLRVGCEPLFKANLLPPLCPPKVGRGRIKLWVGCEPLFKGKSPTPSLSSKGESPSPRSFRSQPVDRTECAPGWPKGGAPMAERSGFDLVLA